MDLSFVYEKIEQAKHKVGRSDNIKILAVTKNQSSTTVQKIIDQGLTLIGENRIQEAKEKYPLLTKIEEKHLIGPLQKNKENNALALFDCIQTLEDIEQTKRLLEKIDSIQIAKKLYIQINTSQEEQKHGLRDLTILHPMIEQIQNSSYGSLAGLMTLGPLSQDETVIRTCFYNLYEIREKLQIQYSIPLELSMGMSNDFEWAIQEGASMIRLGSILFN